MAKEAFYETIYHVEGYTLADAFRPQPGWGTRTFTVKVANLGEHTLDELVAAAHEHAPSRHRLTGVKLYEPGKDAVWLWSIPADPRFAALASGVAEVRHQTEVPAGTDAVGLGLEATAREIYDGWKDEPGWVPWVTGGNSTKQDVARQRARDILASDPGIGHE